jgi:predicted CoA-binding protein
MDMAALLESAKTIAVVGLSDKPDCPSYDVASYLLSGCGNDVTSPLYKEKASFSP